jgi:hypothetical protein
MAVVVLAHWLTLSSKLDCKASVLGARFSRDEAAGERRDRLKGLALVTARGGPALKAECCDASALAAEEVGGRGQTFSLSMSMSDTTGMEEGRAGGAGAGGEARSAASVQISILSLMACHTWE